MMAMPSQSTDRTLFASTATHVAVEEPNVTKPKTPLVPPLCHHQVESLSRKLSPVVPSGALVFAVPTRQSEMSAT